MATACITGASSGIGKALAIRLSRMGYNLILVARNTKALNSLASRLETKCRIIPCDLTDEDSCRTLADTLKKYRLKILVNSAGFGDIGHFHETSLSKDLDMIDVNIKAVHILTKELLGDFIARDEGYILNVSSSAGLFPGGPHMAAYYATKAYITSLTNSISEELKEAGSNVHISALCPGPVNTNFNNTANVRFALKGISADFCAKYALEKMFKNKLIIVPTFTMKTAVMCAKFAPRKIMLRAASHQQRKKYRAR